MNSGRRGSGRYAEDDQQGARDLAERHAQRAVDHLRRKSDQDEREEDGRIGQDFPEDVALHPCWPIFPVMHNPLESKMDGNESRSLRLAFAPKHA